MTEWHLRRNFSSPWRVQVRHKWSTNFWQLGNSTETTLSKERRVGVDAESRHLVQEIMRGAGYLPGAIRELGQQARRGLSPFIGS